MWLPVFFIVKIEVPCWVVQYPPTIMSSSAKIYVGGWARFREESGATRKEAPEDFSWMGEQDIVGATVPRKFSSKSNRLYFEDCRAALEKVEGSKEWLKAYVGVEEGSGEFNFRDKIGKQILLHEGHSGSSWCGIMWSYKALLNDWDGWVLANKEHDALWQYKGIQAPDFVFSRLRGDTGALFAGKSGGNWGPTEEGVKNFAAQWGFQGTLEEIGDMAVAIYLENEERNERERMRRAEEQHRDLVEGVKFKYQHPVRWFDTLSGSNILPRTPHEVTGRAIQEMQEKHPEYKQHLQRVSAAMAEFRTLPLAYGSTSSPNMLAFLKKWSLV
jgi:hypothetical protein